MGVEHRGDDDGHDRGGDGPKSRLLWKTVLGRRIGTYNGCGYVMHDDS